ITQLPLLKGVRFWDSTVEDGDVSPCLQLDYAYFTNKKHYTHKLIEKDRSDDGPSLIEQSVPRATEPVHPLPTGAWKIRMDQGDDLFTEENIAATEKVLQKYSEDIFHLQDPSEEELIRIVQETVFRLNALNEESDFFIETLEREELVEFILEKAQSAGLETEEDLTEEWRE